MDEILSLNNIPDPNNLLEGLVLILPPDANVDAELTLPATYLVQPGETLSAIAVKLGVTREQLIDANENEIADPDIIFAGQELNVPGGGT